MTVRVLVVDDQAMFRDALVTLLGAADDLEVVGRAADGREAVDEARRLRPDVVLMDVRMPVLDGIEATRRLVADRRATAEAVGPRVIVLTTFDVDEHVYAALRAGASGYLLKDASATQLIDAVRVVAAGDALLAPTVTRRLIERFAGRPDLAPAPGTDRLTAREREVLALIGRGRSNAEIAEELVVATETVKTHVGRILAKLDLRDRTQAAVYAWEHGVVRAP